MKNIDHERYMAEALKQAEMAFECGEVPIGAVVIDSSGNIVGRGSNSVEKIGCQSGHAEVQAIHEACKVVGGWRLDGCSMYVTLEPCLMCFGLIGLSRIKKVFFGGRSPLFGAEHEMSGVGQVYKKGLSVHGGLKECECIGILKGFFERARVVGGCRETKASVPGGSQKTAAGKKGRNN